MEYVGLCLADHDASFSERINVFFLLSQVLWESLRPKRFSNSTGGTSLYFSF